ncbi:MAG: hypothetical protein AAF743_02180, partial [Planctomycetota bacterium]
MPAAVIRPVVRTSGGGPKKSDDPVNPLAALHEALKGRYHLAVVAALLVGAAGAAAGWFSREPAYRSEATIRIKPHVPRVLFSGDQNGVMPRFDSFLRTQVALMRGDDVLERALTDDELINLANAPATPEALSGGLDVTMPKGTELLRLSYVSGDAAVTQAALTSIIDSYNALHSEADTAGSAELLQSLLEYHGELERELSVNAAAAEEAAGDATIATLDIGFVDAADDVAMIKSDLR